MSEAGDKIRECRERRGMTQQELSRRTGVARVTIAGYEAGHADPTCGRYVLLLEAMGYRVAVIDKAEAEIRRLRLKEKLK